MSQPSWPVACPQTLASPTCDGLSAASKLPEPEWLPPGSGGGDGDDREARLPRQQARQERDEKCGARGAVPPLCLLPPRLPGRGLLLSALAPSASLPPSSPPPVGSSGSPCQVGSWLYLVLLGVFSRSNVGTLLLTVLYPMFGT
ncbi:uncharacterized protein [Elaeis guineensis]|uniref:uncharacterized protein n=1 Tax=Elaeis guineensis var. tenera TaxID=51953 RepID=UPI003C6D08E2